MVDFQRAAVLTRLRDILKLAFKGESSMGPDEWDQMLLRVAGKVYDAGWCEADEPWDQVRRIAFTAISEERERQDAKFGVQEHGDLYWLAILQEEIGEAAQAVIQERIYEDVEEEMLHVAAVAVSWIECHLRNTGPARGLRADQVGKPEG